MQPVQLVQSRRVLRPGDARLCPADGSALRVRRWNPETRVFDATDWVAPLERWRALFEQQHEASTLGMWFFVAQEILFFGGLFCAYFVYREMYPAAWKAGSLHQNWQIGAANTIVLIGSSLTMALAVGAIHRGDERLERFVHGLSRWPLRCGSRSIRC